MKRGGKGTVVGGKRYSKVIATSLHLRNTFHVIVGHAAGAEEVTVGEELCRQVPDG